MNGACFYNVFISLLLITTFFFWVNDYNFLFFINLSLNGSSGEE